MSTWDDHKQRSSSEFPRSRVDSTEVSRSRVGSMGSSDDSTESTSESESDDYSVRNRLFEYADLIDSMDGAELDIKWSFLLDDGMVESRADFSAIQDLWKHLQRIDPRLQRIRTKGRKGTLRMFKKVYSHCLCRASKVWAGEETEGREGGKWSMRFSSKFTLDIGDIWVELVLAAIAGALPEPENVMGCVFITKSGRCELELWVNKNPIDLTNPRRSEDEQQLTLRRRLGIRGDDPAMLIKYKPHIETTASSSSSSSHGHKERAKERVDKKRKGGATWPMTEKGNDDRKQETIQHNLDTKDRYHPFAAEDLDFNPNSQPGNIISYSTPMRKNMISKTDQDETDNSTSSAMPTTDKKSSVISPGSATGEDVQFQHLHLSDLNLFCEDSDEDHGISFAKTPPVEPINFTTSSNLAGLRFRMDAEDYRSSGLFAAEKLSSKALSSKNPSDYSGRMFESWVPRTEDEAHQVGPPRDSDAIYGFQVEKDTQGHDEDVYVPPGTAASMQTGSSSKSFQNHNLKPPQVSGWRTIPQQMDGKSALRRGTHARHISVSPPTATMAFGTNPPDLVSPLMTLDRNF